MGSGSAAAGTAPSRAKFLLIALGTLVGGLLLAGLGAFYGPYAAITAQTGKYTVDDCQRTGKAARHTLSSRGVDHQCWGTFRSDDGSYTEHRAYYTDKATKTDPYTLHSKGDVIEMDHVNGNYETNTVGTFAFGTGVFFLGFLPLLGGLFALVTSRNFNDKGGWDTSGAIEQADGLFKVCLWIGGIAVIGALISGAVWLLAPS